MKASTKKWIEFAQRDIDAADVLFREEKKMGHLYDIVIFHCHQAIEKFLKAVMNERGHEMLKIHDLVRLLHISEVQLPKDMETWIHELNPHYLMPRYPDLAFKPKFSFTYNKKNVAPIVEHSKVICQFLKKEVKE